jgi:hypothetical protein
MQVVKLVRSAGLSAHDSMGPKVKCRWHWHDVNESKDKLENVAEGDNLEDSKSFGLGKR